MFFAPLHDSGFIVEKLALNIKKSNFAIFRP